MTTGPEGRGGEVRGAESKSYIRYSTRVESSQASVAVFLQDSLFFSAPHCALRSAHCNVHGLGRPSSQDEDQAESGYIHMFVAIRARPGLSPPVLYYLAASKCQSSRPWPHDRQIV